jgi:hypothetical protein
MKSKQEVSDWLEKKSNIDKIEWIVWKQGGESVVIDLKIDEKHSHSLICRLSEKEVKHLMPITYGFPFSKEVNDFIKSMNEFLQSDS